MRAPTVAAAGLRDRYAIIAVADHIDPRPRRAWRGNDIFFAVFGKIAVFGFEAFQSCPSSQGASEAVGLAPKNLQN
jgi:hypothetical protein